MAVLFGLSAGLAALCMVGACIFSVAYGFAVGTGADRHLARWNLVAALLCLAAAAIAWGMAAALAPPITQS